VKRLILDWLVGGLEHGFYFPFHIWDVILPIDELIFFRGVGQPPISDCLLFSHAHTSMHKKDTHTASNDSMMFNIFPI
jgi:hypothetical protein